MSQLLEITRTGRVLRIAINRPDKRNALNAELCQALVSSIEAGEQDPSIGAILLSGRGKAFCAGMDLGEIGPGLPDTLGLIHEQLFTLGVRLVKPLIAAVHGSALGGGTGLVANCHIVLAEPDATFGLTEIRLGLWPFLVFYAVAYALGERRTLELALTGRIVHAAEARDLGLIHEITPDLEARAADLAAQVAGFSPTSIQAGMRFVQGIRGRNWEQASEIARRVRGDVFRTPDFQEGLRAFKEKRVAQWPSLE